MSRQGVGDLVVLGGELLLLLTELPALGLTLLGDGHVAGPPQLPDLPRQLVDVGPQLVAPRRDLAQPLVEHGGRVDLVEQGRIAPSGRRGAHSVEVGAQQPDVDHENGTLPAAGPLMPLRSVAQDCVGRVGSSAGGTRANSRATSSNVNGSSS